MRPMFPSWIRSRNCRPRLVYFLAIETTRRRLASMSSFFACSASISPWMMSRWVRRSSCPALVFVRLAIEHAHRVNRFVDAINQPLALGIHEADFADGLRDSYDLAAQVPAAAAVVFRPFDLWDLA